MAASKQTFQFTLGPVQGFVAQARRTRDFWSGSFILSWLSSVAMASIQQQGGDIRFPVPDPHYLDWLYGKGSSEAPLQGSVPNRFKAMTAEVSANFDPQRVTESVQLAWQTLADCVWRHDLEGVAGAETRAIWQRQVSQFWEISWVLSDGDGGNLLDRRKNWRSTVAPVEPGHKCMMMDGWQELSGVLVNHLTTVNNFWKSVIAAGKPGMKTDLRDGEHLCAMAFIKRRFVHCFDQVRFTLPDSHQVIQGWTLPAAVPSVAFLAAAHWIVEAIEKAPVAAFEQFHDAARKLSGYTEVAHITDNGFAIDIQSVSHAARERSQDGFRRVWAGLDGQLYFPSALQNPRLFEDKANANKVLHALQGLRRAAGLTQLPSPFYAVLLMDGDQLGVHMSDPEKQGPISAALNAFTAGAPDVVRKHNGFLVYAGGDDVLALLPMDDALPAAAALQAFYKQCFALHGTGKVASTLSGAIQFVHIRTPLTRVLQDAHELLDDIAKEKTGRNAIAVRVWKPSGLAAEWSMPWDKALDAEGNVLICRLADQFARQQGEEAHFSSKFFFRAGEIIRRFPDMPADALLKVLQAEYLHSFGSRGSRAGGEGQVELLASLQRLLDQSGYWHRAEGAADIVRKGLNPDAALLVRFLAEKGMEGDAV